MLLVGVYLQMRVSSKPRPRLSPSGEPKQEGPNRLLWVDQPIRAVVTVYLGPRSSAGKSDSFVRVGRPFDPGRGFLQQTIAVQRGTEFIRSRKANVKCHRCIHGTRSKSHITMTTLVADRGARYRRTISKQARLVSHSAVTARSWITKASS
jgi:hypothetical protein